MVSHPYIPEGVGVGAGAGAGVGAGAAAGAGAGDQKRYGRYFCPRAVVAGVSYMSSAGLFGSPSTQWAAVRIHLKYEGKDQHNNRAWTNDNDCN